MALPGDPSGTITYQVTDQGGGNYRLRRKIQTGSQFRIIDVTNACVDYLNLAAETLAAAEGGTVL